MKIFPEDVGGEGKRASNLIKMRQRKRVDGESVLSSSVTKGLP